MPGCADAPVWLRGAGTGVLWSECVALGEQLRTAAVEHVLLLSLQRSHAMVVKLFTELLSSECAH